MPREYLDHVQSEHPFGWSARLEGPISEKRFSRLIAIFLHTRVRSCPGKPNERKVSSRTLHRGIPEQKFNVNRACFPRKKFKHQNSQKNGQNSYELFVLALSLVWFATGRLLIKPWRFCSMSHQQLSRVGSFLTPCSSLIQHSMTLPLVPPKNRHRVNGVGQGGGQAVFNQILPRGPCDAS